MYRGFGLRLTTKVSSQPVAPFSPVTVSPGSSPSAALFCLTNGSKVKKNNGCNSRVLPVYSPSQSCCQAPQRGSSLGLEGWPGSRTRPSSCLESWKCWVLSHQKPGHSSLLRGRRQRLRTGTSPDLPCPKSEWQRKEEGTERMKDNNVWSQVQNNEITLGKEIKVIP